MTWKPGDVAMVVCSDGEERIALYEPDVNLRDAWLFASGGRRRVSASQARPLAVIDPESDEDLERLADTYYAYPSEGWKQQMRKALRAYAAPTPPRCSAALNIRGQHFQCDSEPGHGMPHGSKAAEAIWGES